MAGAHKLQRAMENRELSWLKFNARIQDEADRTENPLLERAKFLSIVTSNMDEFFQVRYERLYLGAETEDEAGKDGELSPQKLYRKVNKELLRQCNRQYVLYEGIRSELFLKGIQLYPTFLFDAERSEREKQIFEEDIKPYLKDEALQTAHIRQKQIYLCVKLLRSRRKAAQFRVVALPPSLPRWFNLSTAGDTQCLMKLEDIVKHHAYRLFPREEVEHVAAFRILRNQNFEVIEETRADVVPGVEQMLKKRITGRVARLEAEESMSEEMLTLLMSKFQVLVDRRYRVTGPLDLGKLMMGLYSMLNRPELKYPVVLPRELPELMGDDVFDVIDREDFLLYHPYHSFQPIVHLMERAAVDPTVKSIKQTLYRVSGNSPIVAALVKAAENGKNVLVLFEAHARFDEEPNLFLGRQLEEAGCRVLYGLPHMKVHSKVTLFERIVEGQLRREVHLGTGNYNDSTAKLYTDFGLLTADEMLTRDAAAFFEILQGREGEMIDIYKAPDRMSPQILWMIDRERQNAEAGIKARIMAKMNGLSDKKIIRALIKASKAGVQINLMVRGVCCLKPEIEGISENIHVRSIVGRHLEHARAFWFENGGDDEVYLSSADWMSRNLSRRAELLFPIKDERCREAVKNVLTLQWNDTQKCRHCNAEGVYELYPREDGLNAQECLLADIDGVFAGTVPLCIVEEVTDEIPMDDIDRDDNEAGEEQEGNYHEEQLETVFE